MNTTRRALTIARAVFYTLVSGMVIYHIAEAFSQNPLEFRIEKITIEKDGKHLLHCEIKNESWFPVELAMGGGHLCLPGYKRYGCYGGEQTGICLVRLTTATINDCVLLKPGERIKYIAPMPFRLRPDQSTPNWCTGLYFEYAWIPRIVSRLGILLRKHLPPAAYDYEEPFRALYIPRVVEIPVELPKAVPRSL